MSIRSAPHPIAIGGTGVTTLAALKQLLALAVSATQTGSFNGVIHTSHPVDISAGSAVLSLPDCNTNIGLLVEAYIIAVPSPVGTYSLSFGFQTAGDILQAPAPFLTDLYGCVGIRAMGAHVWQMVYRN